MADGSVPLALIFLRERLAEQLLGLQQAMRLFDQAHPEVLEELKRVNGEPPGPKAVSVNPFAPAHLPQAPRAPVLEEERSEPTASALTIQGVRTAFDSRAEAMNGHAIAPGRNAHTRKDGSPDRRYRAEIDAVHRGDKDEELMRLWHLNWSCQRIAHELQSNMTNVSRRAKAINLPKRHRAAVIDAGRAARTTAAPPPRIGHSLKLADINLNIEAARRFPEDAPAFANMMMLESEAEAVGGTRFKRPVDRRCPVCTKIFKTRIVDETICHGCRKIAHGRAEKHQHQDGSK
jgi:hypothetical protein